MSEVNAEIIVTIAAKAAAEVVARAAAAALEVSSTAAQAAHTLAETTRLDLAYIKADIREIKNRLDNKYVSLDVFDPVRKLVYGLVGIVLIAVANFFHQPSLMDTKDKITK